MGLGVLGVVPGAAPAHAIGPSTMRSDFNGDGRDELLVAAPGEDLRSVRDAGVLHVLNGSASGVTTAGDVMLAEGSSLSGTAESGDAFSLEYAAGDFDGDGFDDLMAPTPFQSVVGHPDAGQIHLIPGSAAGLDLTADVVIDQESPGVPSNAADGEAFGFGSAVGDFDGDGFDDLAVGAPGEEVFGRPDAGAVFVFSGSAAGLQTASGVQLLTQGTLGLDRAERGDFFGDQLAAGDTDGDGRDDLVISSAGEDVGAYVNAGVAVIVLGGPDGLSASGARLVGQDTEGVPGDAETDDQFANALAVGDLDGDGFAEVVVGALEGRLDRGTGAESGALWVLPGSASGPQPASAQRWNQDSPGVADRSERGDRFAGFGLAVGDVDGDGFADLAVGCDGEDDGRGAAYLFYGSAAGLVGADAQRFLESGLPLATPRLAGEFFGASVSLRDYDGDGSDDLSIGAYADRVTTVRAGSVFVLRSDGDRLDPASALRIAQGRNGVEGKAEAGDQFGSL